MYLIPFRFALLECSVLCALVFSDVIEFDPRRLGLFLDIPRLHTIWFSFYVFELPWRSITWTPKSYDLAANVYFLDQQLGYSFGLQTILTFLLQLRVDVFCVHIAMECISCKTGLDTEMFHYKVSHLGIELQTILTRNLGCEVDDNANLCDGCFLSITLQLSSGSQKQIDSKCIKCQRSIIGLRSHTLPIGPERDIISAAISPQQIQPTNRVCYRCWVAACRNVQREKSQPCKLCVRCERSIEQLRSYPLRDGPLRDYIATSIAPRQIESGNRVCAACLEAAKKRLKRAHQHDLNRTQLALNDNRQSPTQQQEISTPSTNKLCVWCQKSIAGEHKHSLPECPERNCIAEHISPRQIQSGDMVCYACWLAARRYVQGELQDCDLSASLMADDDNQPSTSQQPQPSTSYQPDISMDTQCVCCQRPLDGRRTHSLPDGCVRDRIAVQIAPREIESHNKVCYACWVAVSRNIRSEEARQDDTERFPRKNTQLPNYKRTANAANKCFVYGCTNTERLCVPQYLKHRLLKEYKLYVTEMSRICRDHMGTYDWDFITTNICFYISEFTPSQIEATITLALGNEETQFDFENIDDMPDEICHYWTGVSKSNFNRILEETPLLQRHKNYKTMLAVYLIKLRTGEPHLRLGLLFNMTKSNISGILKNVRNVLHEQFVPLHMGVGHMSRNNIVHHNLLIPEGLFGGEERGQRAIVICDGTYVYLQKSSNYYFQKKSYSLHKYKNLVKPFLIVATDGYILDIYGPYAATVSDATIMSQLFMSETNELRQYFCEEDVFILDRGFRDCMDLLRNLNYNVHAPESLEEGETQLPALRANQSRLVTMCRWVVEAVNGYFKTDFKLFRNEFSNNAATHLMMDFRIGGAIINAFHEPIIDSPHAPLILERALQRVNLDNILSEIIIENNVNRMRAIFAHIDAEQILLDEFPVLSESDLILFALGTYQIKQARSYYGEHVRENGTFYIEICNNTEPLEIPELEEMLLLRGRIKSRHRSGKIYYTYIVLNVHEEDWEHRIHSYYCSCVIGKRTVGCCAHIMTIVWYMGWARHQPTAVLAPAAGLDDILVREDVENEE